VPTLSALVVLAGVLAAVPPLAAARRVPTGEWGGAHARLDVQASTARVELDCGHGTIEGALRLGRGGRFRANGSYQSERGPSVGEGDAEGRPARYSGMLKGNVLTLRILTEDGQQLGPFQLERGARAELVKCQ
jgi:hypothetical protein